MVVNRHRQHPFGMRLTDHIVVENFADFFRRRHTFRGLQAADFVSSRMMSMQSSTHSSQINTVLCVDTTASSSGINAEYYTVEMLVGGPKQAYTLVGSLGFGEADNLLGTSWAVFELTTAQELLDAVGQVDAIELTIEPAGDLDTIIGAVGAVLPDGIEAVSSQSVAEEQTAQIKEGLGFLNTLLLAFAGISLFVGIFVIYNAFRIVVAQRTRELGLLRAIGATRGQVTHFRSLRICRHRVDSVNSGRGRWSRPRDCDGGAD